MGWHYHPVEITNFAPRNRTTCNITPEHATNLSTCTCYQLYVRSYIIFREVCIFSLWSLMYFIEYRDYQHQVKIAFKEVTTLWPKYLANTTGQGGPPSSLLFPVFTNELSLYTKTFSIAKFADSTQNLISKKKQLFPSLYSLISSLLLASLLLDKFLKIRWN